MSLLLNVSRDPILLVRTVLNPLASRAHSPHKCTIPEKASIHLSDCSGICKLLEAKHCPWLTCKVGIHLQHDGSLCSNILARTMWANPRVQPCSSIILNDRSFESYVPRDYRVYCWVFRTHLHIHFCGVLDSIWCFGVNCASSDGLEVSAIV